MVIFQKYVQVFQKGQIGEKLKKVIIDQIIEIIRKDSYYLMTRYIIFFFFFIIYSFEIFAQPDSRFRPFDWTIFKGAGSINSISEGYTYIYLATQTGGLKRFNLFSNKFDEPITRAQGLKNNSINATHFDFQTGLLWIATKNFLQYSFSREGDWYNIRLDELGLMKRDKVENIGKLKFIL